MSAGTVAPHRPGQQTGRDGFAQLLRAEWTKFRTVRGWVIGTLVGISMVFSGISRLMLALAAKRAMQHLA